MKRAFYEFLDVNMSIPTSTTSKMQIKNISHNQEIDFQTITVEFCDICPVNTIFRFVKNLAPEQKVSIFIPSVLEAKHEYLSAQAYQLRNDHIKHKTVIKYLGHDLGLYAKKSGGRKWQLVSSPLLNAQPDQNLAQKRPRVEDFDKPDEDASKKAKKAVENPTTDTRKDPANPMEKTPPRQTGIPLPVFSAVPSYSRHSPLQTPAGAFWKPDDPRSPAPLKSSSKN